VRCTNLSRPILAGIGPRRHRMIRQEWNVRLVSLQSATAPCPAQPGCS
jgi:hypothetical protein